MKVAEVTAPSSIWHFQTEEKRPSLPGLHESQQPFVFISRLKGPWAERLILTQGHKGTPASPTRRSLSCDNPGDLEN